MLLTAFFGALTVPLIAFMFVKFGLVPLISFDLFGRSWRFVPWRRFSRKLIPTVASSNTTVSFGPAGYAMPASLAFAVVFTFVVGTADEAYKVSNPNPPVFGPSVPSSMTINFNDQNV
jgi:hypothetical protein